MNMTYTWEEDRQKMSSVVMKTTEKNRGTGGTDPSRPRSEVLGLVCDGAPLSHYCAR